MPGPWVAFLSSPIHLMVVLGNRILTWTGLAVVWRRCKAAPNRLKRFILWALAINGASLIVLATVLRLLKAHA